MTNTVQYSKDSYRVCNPSVTLKKTIKKLKDSGIYNKEALNIYDIGHYDILNGNVIGVKGNSLLSMGREYSWGKGSNIDQAFTGAIMERVERYSLEKFKGIKRIKSTFNNLKVSNKISFRTLIEGYGYTVSTKDKNFFYNLIRNNTIDDYTFEWVKTISLFDNKTYFIPYYKKEYGSNGICTGNTINEALLHGIWEMIERHTSNIIMANVLDPKIIDISNIKNKEIISMIENIESKGFEVYFLDFSMDFVSPTINILIYNKKYQVADFCYMNWHSGTCLDKDIAFIRALSEVIQNRATQIFLSIKEPIKLEGDYSVDEKMPTTKLMNHFLYNIRNKKYDTILYSEINNLSTKDIDIDLDIVLKDLKSKGYNVFYVDTSYPGLDIPVLKVIIPGFQQTIFEEGEYLDNPNLRLSDKHLDLQKINKIIYDNCTD